MLQQAICSRWPAAALFKRENRQEAIKVPSFSTRKVLVRGGLVLVYYIFVFDLLEERQTEQPSSLGGQQREREQSSPLRFQCLVGRRVLKREINKLPAADDDGGGGGAASGGAKAWNISSLAQSLSYRSTSPLGILLCLLIFLHQTRLECIVLCARRRPAFLLAACVFGLRKLVE